jgi:hypothetical protein
MDYIYKKTYAYAYIHVDSAVNRQNYHEPVNWGDWDLAGKGTVSNDEAVENLEKVKFHYVHAACVRIYAMRMESAFFLNYDA